MDDGSEEGRLALVALHEANVESRLAARPRWPRSRGRESRRRSRGRARRRASGGRKRQSWAESAKCRCQASARLARGHEVDPRIPLLEQTVVDAPGARLFHVKHRRPPKPLAPVTRQRAQRPPAGGPPSGRSSAPPASSPRSGRLRRGVAGRTSVELRTQFRRTARDGRVVEALGKPTAFIPPQPRDLLLLPARGRARRAASRAICCQISGWSSGKLRKRRRAPPRGRGPNSPSKSNALRRDAVLLHRQTAPQRLRRRDHAAACAARRGPLERPRFSSKACTRRDSPTQPSANPMGVSRWSALSARRLQPILRPRGEHPVGLRHPPRHQVVDHHPDVGLAPAREPPAALAQRPRRRVQPGDQALTRGLLIARRPVDLPGEEQPRRAP